MNKEAEEHMEDELGDIKVGDCLFDWTIQISAIHSHMHSG